MPVADHHGWFARSLCLAAPLALLSLPASLAAGRPENQEERRAVRYGMPVDLKRFPQDSPPAALGSLIKAASLGEMQYLIAHLVTPAEVDAKLRGSRRALAELARRAKPQHTRAFLQMMKRHLAQGEWQTTRRTAISRIDRVPTLRLHKTGQRWYLANAIRPARKPRSSAEK